MTADSFSRERTTAWHESRGGESALWMGGLVDGMRDPTGQVYMRNRYYNPQTGQFTQMDPIGIAGGMNAYGFAAGDPITYSDPFGLKAANDDCKKVTSSECPIKLAPVEVSVPVYHNRCDVAEFLRVYISALGSRPFDFVDFEYPPELDPKYYNQGHVFEVQGQVLHADEFGNYAAGYAGQHAYAEAGYAAMILGGIIYASTFREEHWSDRESRPMINAGASRARLEQTYDGRTRGMRGIGIVNTPYVEPLTSKAGCK